jgi:hypothetical protein
MIPPVFVPTERETRVRLLALDHRQLKLTVHAESVHGLEHTHDGEATLLVEEKDDTLSVRVHYIGELPESKHTQFSFTLTEAEFKSITTDAAGFNSLPNTLVRPMTACISK